MTDHVGHTPGGVPAGSNRRNGSAPRPRGPSPRLLPAPQWGVTCDGDREVLGLWWQETEGSKFWLAVLNDLKRRGVDDVLIACVDGLTGFLDAIEAVFPQAWVQTCIVHLIRSSMLIDSLASPESTPQNANGTGEESR